MQPQRSAIEPSRGISPRRIPQRRAACRSASGFLPGAEGAKGGACSGSAKIL